MRSTFRIFVVFTAFGALSACMGGGSGGGTTDTVEHSLEAARIIGAKDLQGFVVAGTPTADFSSFRAVSADYNGRAVIDLYEDPATGPDRLRADLMLTASFSDSTIAGLLRNSTLQKAGQDSPEDFGGFTALMPVTGFGDTGFEGAFMVLLPSSEASFDLSYEGAFYGPNAESVAGLISGTAEIDGSRIATGWFGGDQNIGDDQNE